MVQSAKNLGNTFFVVISLKPLFDNWLRFLALPKVLSSFERKDSFPPFSQSDKFQVFLSPIWGDEAAY